MGIESTESSAAQSGSPADGPFQLAECLKIGEAEKLHQDLQSRIEVPDLQIDGTAVHQIDTAAVQLLASFFADRAEAGLITAWSGVSDELRQVSQLLGVSQALSLSSKG